MSVRNTVWPAPVVSGSRAARHVVFLALLLALLAQSACTISDSPTTAHPTPPNTACSATASRSGATTYSASAVDVTTHQAPLVYGTNFALYDASDQVINEPAAQSLLRIYGVPVIRMPFRFTLSDAFEVRAMQVIRSVGALPVVIVHGPNDVNALADDVHIISLVKSVFGDSVVYVEFGNEPELAGISAQAYATSWNRVISCLKSLAPTYKFVGPANSYYNPDYVATFDQLANPRPDFNSWHEYACAPHDSNDTCMRQLDNWTSHITGMNTAVHQAIGATIPVMVTEWNLDDRPDPRYQDTAFIQAWTATALHVLAANQSNGLYAAMQYCVANNPNLSLISSSGLFTPAGQAFFQTLLRARTGKS